MRGLKFLEAGRRNNAGDQKMIQGMHDSAVSLGADCAAMESAWYPDPDFHFTEADMSYGDITDLIRSALRLQYSGAGIWVYPRDVYADSVVYSVSNNDDSISKLYQRSYSLTNATVTFTSDPVEVQAVTNYLPVAESESGVAESAEIISDVVPLVEKSVKKDGTASIKIIAPGQGSSGFYPAEVLKRDASVFKEGTQLYLDHPSASDEANRPERSVRDLAGSTTGPATWQDNGAAGPGIYAPVKFIDSVASHINDVASICGAGMSIRAAGKAGTREIDGKKVRTIESIDVAHSIDVVTKAGAGGSILDLIESARKRAIPPIEGDDVDKAAFDKLTTDLTEAQSTIATLQAWKADQEKRDADAKVLKEAHGIVTKALSTTSLPNLVRERLAGSLTANATVKDGALDTAALTAAIEAAVKTAADELAEATGGNPIRGMGSTPPKDEDVTAGLVESFMAAGHSKEIAERMAAL